MGFAEIIERQYLGPADHRYRTRAGEIMAQARILLEAIDDLDFAAKLQAAQAEPAATADLATIARELDEFVTAAAAAKGLAVRFDPTSAAPCAVNHELGRRLIRRYCLALIDAAAAREAFDIAFETAPGQCLVVSVLPGRMRAAAEQDLFASDEPAAVWVRLLRGLARIAGGDLTVASGRLVLALPRAGGG